MPSNVALNAGSGGANAATKQRSHDGDTAQVQVVTIAGVTGTEDSYTFADIAHGGGVEAAALRVTIASDSTGVLSVDDNGGSLTVDVGTALPAGTNNIGDVDVLSVVPGTGATALGKAIDTAAGGTDTGVAVLAVRDDALTTLTPVDGDYVPLRTDSTGSLHVRVSAGGIAGIADDAAFTVGTSETVPVGFLADETAPDSVDEGDMGAARMTLDRKQIVTPRPHASGGLSIFRSLDLDESEEEIKASAGQLYGYYFYNAAASARYLKFYNATAANVTVGTTTPVLTIPVPATTAGHVSFEHGIAFGTAITAAVTTGLADNDTGAPSANDFILNALYA